MGYEPGNVDELSQQIAKVLKDPAGAATRSTKARQELIKNFSSEHYLSELIETLTTFHGDEGQEFQPSSVATSPRSS